MTQRLLNKQVLITGGTSGIGLEAAKQCLKEGAYVTVTGRSQEGLAHADIVLDGQARLIQSDSADVQQQQELAQHLSRVLPTLDVVYVNAGDVTHQKLQDWHVEDFDRVMNTNLKGPFFLLQSLLPLLSDGASIILCGSVSAQIGLPQSSVYAASKAGLISLARTLSGELKHRGIRVNSLSPGPTRTPAFDKVGLDAKEKAALFDDVAALVPLERMGTPSEIAKAMVFLASEESSYMLGTELLVDGGVGNV
ncbi:SDR family oxidoreductase [Vibrio coralliilyticus]|uniref:SDR family oxidoreductase n=1 Tax=Vibrio coralliilyticus TaxID=190893 RepID=UPI000BAAC3A6|nr:SDR family oxidoreductase [Vibrio coralliilyticus]NOI58994.1 SDR family oxidoreductase [Vibrio coralliilyticus]PAT66766.1 short-chain dehydrogenase [Vibrio coralliilyticus]